MLKNKINIIFFVCLFILGGYCYYANNRIRTPYVSMSEVYQQSDLSKKFALELKKFEDESNQELRKIEAQINDMQKRGIDSKTIDYEQKALLQKRDQLSQDYQKKSESYDKIVWNDINGKISKYGKEKGYDYILGANGNGSIMYASERINITDDVIDFINK